MNKKKIVGELCNIMDWVEDYNNNSQLYNATKKVRDNVSRYLVDDPSIKAGDQAYNTEEQYFNLFKEYCKMDVMQEIIQTMVDVKVNEKIKLYIAAFDSCKKSTEKRTKELKDLEKRVKVEKDIILQYKIYNGSIVVYRNADVNIYKSTKLSMHILAMLLWYDIYINDYPYKHKSQFYTFVRTMTDSCPLCEYQKMRNYRSKCSTCVLKSCMEKGSHYYNWNRDIESKKNAKAIFLKIKEKVDQIIAKRNSSYREHC